MARYIITKLQKWQPSVWIHSHKNDTRGKITTVWEHYQDFNTTSFQSNLATGHITDLSPPVAANGFVQCWPRESASKRHLNWFSRLCTAHPCDQQTDRQTDRTTCDICSNRPHWVQAMRPKNGIKPIDKDDDVAYVMAG